MVAPSKFAHVVYNTHRYDEMIEWYRFVFEADVVHRNPAIAFLTYDDEHHRFAFANMGPVPDGEETPSKRRGVGVNHVAYTFSDLGELVDHYERLKGRDIVPNAPVRHGMTLSMYYADPDGNSMEFQVDLMTADEATRFMESPAFEANPIGEPFDPDELLRRFRADDDLDDVVFRSDQEPFSLAALRG
ncbi:MAG: VOC family protein [Actinomycetota bacterium]